MEKKYCYYYPHPAVTVDCLIFGFDGESLKVLLIRRGNEPFKGMWAFPGGFLNPDENAMEGALRELKEETGMDAVPVEQFHTFSQPGRDPRERIITVSFLSLVRMCEVSGGDDASEASWFPVHDLPALAFDHELMFTMAAKRLSENISFKVTESPVLPADFNVGELRLIQASLHEALGGK